MINILKTLMDNVHSMQDQMGNVSREMEPYERTTMKTLEN